MKILVTFDGGCLYDVKGAGAAVAFDKDGVQVARMSTYIAGPGVTTNICEYSGLCNALSLVLHLRPDEAKVLGDSELIVRQFNGKYACRSGIIKPWHAMATDLARQVQETGCELVVDLFPKAGPKNKRRFGNHISDALATATMKAESDIFSIGP